MTTIAHTFGLPIALGDRWYRPVLFEGRNTGILIDITVASRAAMVARGKAMRCADERGISVALELHPQWLKRGTDLGVRP